WPVNLGPREAISNLDLDRSDFVTVRGRCAVKDAAGRLVASSLDFRGETIALNGLNGGFEREEFARTGEWRDLRGEILSTHIETFREVPHTIARVRFDDGRVELIDLGPQRNLRDVELREGARVMLHARPGEFAGRTRMLADRMEVNGRTVYIERQREELA